MKRGKKIKQKILLTVGTQRNYSKNQFVDCRDFRTFHNPISFLFHPSFFLCKAEKMVSASVLAPFASSLLGLIKVVGGGVVKDFFAGDKDLIEKLGRELLTADAILSDAEEKQITNPNVKEWLNELKYAAYDADDLLDEVTTATLESKKKGKIVAAAKDLGKRVATLFPFYNGVIDQLKKIVERLQDLTKQIDLLNLPGCAKVKPPPRRQTTSLLYESEVFGRDKDKEELMERLLVGTAQVIAIVGIPGVGKTTLAQLLYNDSRVMKHFSEFRAWVHVSEELDVFEVTRTIFESVVSQNCHVTNLNVLQEKLVTTLSGKRFLLVIDDIWNENSTDWGLLSAPFKAGACGSRIIVTTRNQGVASTMGDNAPHHLPQLSEECCRKLFEKYAFGIRNPNDHPILKSIGHDIAIKCQGLPLAAKTLGSLLHSQSEADQWRGILNSKIWNLPNDENSILPALKLSYDRLHPRLKQCFAYCSVFSKGYKFEKEKLIYMWMAEGFLQQPDGEVTMEESGEKYFLELLSRSFFHASSHSKQHFVMHDLINDLAQFVSGQFCFKFEDGKPQGIPEKARHSAWSMNRNDDHKKFEDLLRVESMRTFHLLRSSNNDQWSTLNTIFSERKLSKQLRVLSLSVNGIIKLPDLQKLKHLRYLDLSDTSILDLPKETCVLYNMQTLLLSNCYSLTGLPAEIGRLTNLRHLDVRGCTSITKLPAKFGKLTNLQKLTDFWVGEAEDESSKISELGKLSCLRGRLSISRLENVDDAQQASEANLKCKTHLRELIFKWTTDETMTDHYSVLINLEPHTFLEKLTIENYSGKTFPFWLSDVKFSNMVILRLTQCNSCESLPSLEQLSSLQELYITKMKKIELVTFGSRGLQFRSLKILSFRDLQSWTTLTCHLQFPSLQELRIQDCRQLNSELPNPTYLPCLQTLILFDCPNLSGEGMLADISTSRKNSDLKILGEKLCGLTSLKELQVTSLSIRNLEILDERFCGLTSLQELQIGNCNKLQLMWTQGLPPDLQSLVITDCKELNAEEEWDLYRMESPTCSETTNESPLPNTLTSLCIDIRPRKLWGLDGMESLINFEIAGKCNEGQSFPEDRLPLRISTLPHLINLVEGFQHLTSLKSLEIKCSNLKSIQAEELPTSKKDKGKDWHKLFHISHLKFDESAIQLGQTLVDACGLDFFKLIWLILARIMLVHVSWM